MRAIQDCDVLVVGGGPAGLGATAGAAMSGASAFLVEKLGFAGGQAASALVGSVCGLYVCSETEDPEPVQRGFPLEFSQRLARASGTAPVRIDRGLHVLPYDHLAFRTLCDDLLGRLPNAEPTFHATLSEVDVVNDQIVRAQTLTPDDRLDYRPRAVVDCTGNAAVARMAGAFLDERGAAQPPAIVFTVDNVEETPLSRETCIATIRRVVRAVEEGRLPERARTLSFNPVSDKPGRVYLKTSLLAATEADWNWRSRLERDGRKLIERLFAFLKNEAPAFAGARPGPLPIEVGHRSGPRALGPSILMESDIISGRRSPEAVARAAWPVEFWTESSAPDLIFPPENGYYDIPYGCLAVRRYHNLFTAGKCFSATSRAMASARVIGTCLATGWAAGRMAAAHAEKKRPEEAIKTIQKDWKRDQTGIWK